MPTAETNRTKIIARLGAEGWLLARHGGGHDVYTHPDRTGIAIIVPRHRTVSPGVAWSIAKTAGWL